uniref:CARD domain-containing protein n=1 Tax=Oncorhynchus tshawytscha TaxID=74940 RepID=A0A8C8J4H2_ONCTS
MRQDSSYYNNWIPRNWGEKRGKKKVEIKKASTVVLDQLMDDLLEDKVLKEKYKQRADKARQLIDSVRRKGNIASEMFLIRLQERDNNVYSELGLTPRST